MDIKVKEKVVAELQKIVSAEYVSTTAADLYYYSQDMTENEPSWPDLVVMPNSVEEVQEVLRLANREKIPVIPYSSGANVGGLTIPLKGGIVLDLKRMNHLIEFNEEDMYIIVEPGFTFGDLRRLFDKKYPHLWYGFVHAPPSCSLIGNALLHGFGYNGNSLGLNSDNVNGMEVVLATGEVVKIGSCSLNPYWSNRAPLPDLAGLFLGWQGATGVVTKMAFQLWPRRLRQLKQIITTGIHPTCTFLRKLCQTRICEEAVTAPLDMAQAGTELFRGTGEATPEERRPSLALKIGITSATYDRPPGPETFAVMAVVEGDTEDEVKAKVGLLDVIIKEELKDTQFTDWPGQWYDMWDLPIVGGGEVLGGLTWIGSMGPTSQWAVALEKIFPVFDKYRIVRMSMLTGFRWGHWGMLRSAVQFNKGDPDEVERVKKCMRETLIMTLDAGFVPYKAPYWAVEEMMRRGDPNWVELLIRVKKMLDPNNIMNPGRYGDTRG